MSSGGPTSERIYRSSTTAPVNIAVIKYWGKRDVKLNLPTNSSLSVTLNQLDLRTHTTASCSALYPAGDTLELNGKPDDIGKPRTQACLKELRALRQFMEIKNLELPPLSTFPLRIATMNNFPTAAGLASSAAGFAALVRAIADLYELPTTPVELSRIARQGSGSACRSLFGGYVAWDQGRAPDGSDSMARPVFPASHWPTIRALILVVSAAQKDISSTNGMQLTTQTSALFDTRARDVVPTRMRQMEAAIRERDFSTFALLTMRDSNTFHATCADTYPPIFYLTDTSKAAIRMCEAVNRAAGEIVCAYTFDAGPNAVIFYEEKSASWVEGCFRAVLPDVQGWKGQDSNAPQPGEAITTEATTSTRSPAAFQLDDHVASPLREKVSRIILTSVGEGPIRVQDHLVDATGNVR